ncbi:MAG: hypothetical protein ACYDC6_14265 [Acidobacteriaceae bacterium]
MRIFIEDKNGNFQLRNVSKENIKNYDAVGEKYIYHKGKPHTAKNRRFHHKSTIYKKAVTAKLVVVNVFARSGVEYDLVSDREFYLKAGTKDRKIESEIKKVVDDFNDRNGLKLRGRKTGDTGLSISVGQEIRMTDGGWVTMGETNKEIERELTENLRTEVKRGSHHTKVERRRKSIYKDDYDNNEGVR